MIKTNNSSSMNQIISDVDARLITQDAAWPLQRILLILRGKEQDQCAIDCTIKFAQASQARVTVLVIVPDLPFLYNKHSSIQLDLKDLLLLDTTPGVQLRYLLKRMQSLEIECELVLHHAPPAQQIRREVGKGHYDLIVISAERRSWISCLFFGELVKPVILSSDSPVLVAKYCD